MRLDEGERVSRYDSPIYRREPFYTACAETVSLSEAVGKKGARTVQPNAREGGRVCGPV